MGVPFSLTTIMQSVLIVFFLAIFIAVLSGDATGELADRSLMQFRSTVEFGCQADVTGKRENLDFTFHQAIERVEVTNGKYKATLDSGEAVTLPMKACSSVTLEGGDISIQSGDDWISIDMTIDYEGDSANVEYSYTGGSNPNTS